MITVNYLDGVDNIRCDEHLFQWDNGQKLCLSGLNGYVSNLETVDVHFCNKISKMAITVKPTVVSKNIVAPIPNSLLQDPYPIIAYFYVPSDNGSRTIVMVTIPIEPKKRPSDFVLNEDEAIASLEVINNKVNTMLNNLTVDYNNFKTNIEAELRDIVTNLKLDDAKTLQSHPPSDFAVYRKISTDEIDNITETGFYITHTPAPSQFIIHITWINNSNMLQIRNTFSTYLQFRLKKSGTWGAWINVNDGGNADTVDGKHASSFALKTDLPTSLPANGGNADTVDGKHASSFAQVKLLGTDYNVDDITESGLYGCGKIESAGFVGCTLIHITYSNNYMVQIACNFSLKIKSRSKRDGTWGAWINVNDGGNADTVDGKHASDISINSNILINPNFKINQRGKTTYNSQGYTVDGWQLIKHSSASTIGSVTINTNYVSVSGGGNRLDTYFRQYIANAVEILSGKTVTLSFKVDVSDQTDWFVGQSNGKYVKLSETSIDKNGIGHMTFIWDGTQTIQAVNFFNNVGTTELKVYWIKLEIGDMATQFVSPMSAIELLKIQAIDGKIHANTATTATKATTATTATTVNGVKLLVGTREPQVEEPNALAYVPDKAWYGKY